MKKLLTLVLVLAVASMASAATFTVVDNEDGTVDINYVGEIVGMGLDIDTTGGLQIASVSLPAFFDVYMDYAYVAEGAYVYGEGTPYATQGAAGVATMPSSSFCISAGGLEDDEFDEAPTSGTITLTIENYASLAEGTYTIVVSENSLRGGVVGFDGAMTTDLETTGSVDIVIAGSEDPVCVGDIDGNGAANVQDIANLITYLNTYGVGPAKVVADTSPNYNPAADIDGNGAVNVQDIANLITYLNTYGVGPAKIVACP